MASEEEAQHDDQDQGDNRFYAIRMTPCAVVLHDFMALAAERRSTPGLIILRRVHRGDRDVCRYRESNRGSERKSPRETNHHWPPYQ